MASLDKEWNKLISQKCWDYASVREWREVAADADKQGIKAHVGRIFDICVEKNSELPEGDPNRKYKGSRWSLKVVTSKMSITIGQSFLRSPRVLLPWKPVKPQTPLVCFPVMPLK